MLIFLPPPWLQTRAASRRPTATTSTTRRRYLNSCPASRPSTPVRAHSQLRRGVPSQGAEPAAGPCPDGAETRSLHRRSKTSPCPFRGREPPGGSDRRPQESRSWSHVRYQGCHHGSCVRCLQVQEEHTNQQHWLLGVLEAEPKHPQ